MGGGQFTNHAITGTVKGADLQEYAYIPSHVIDKCDSHLRNNTFFGQRDSSLNIYTIPMAKSGNRMYAGRLMDRVRNALTDMNMTDGDCLFITFGSSYKYTEAGITEAWKQNNKELPKFLRRMRKLKFRSYMWVREAYELGGCHSHVIIKMPGHVMPYFEHIDHREKKILCLDDEELRSKIQNAWKIGNLDIQVISSEGAGAYLEKEIGKTGHIETALSHAKKHIATAADVKKLWSLYMAIKLKIRRWGVSRDLVKHLTNPTDEEGDEELKEYVEIPKSIREAEYFEPYNQLLDPKSRTYYELNKIFDERADLRRSVFENLGLVRPPPYTANILEVLSCKEN